MRNTRSERAPASTAGQGRLPARLLALTAVAAGADAVSYLGLGQVFPANMTGNTVLLAIGLSTGSGGDAARAGVALGGFVTGAVLAGAVAGGAGRGDDARRWTRATTASLTVEALVLAAFTGWWIAAGPHPAGGVRYGLIALVSLAMGGQSATVTRLGAGVSTTYITGTWTAVSSWVGGRLHPARRSGDPVRPQPRLQIAVLICYLGAALLAGWAYHAATG